MMTNNRKQLRVIFSFHVHYTTIQLMYLNKLLYLNEKHEFEKFLSYISCENFPHYKCYDKAIRGFVYVLIWLANNRGALESPFKFTREMCLFRFFWTMLLETWTQELLSCAPSLLIRIYTIITNKQK